MTRNSPGPAAQASIVGVVGESGMQVVDEIDSASIADAQLLLAGAQREGLQDVALAAQILHETRPTAVSLPNGLRYFYTRLIAKAEQIKKIGIDEAVEIYNTAYNRYQSR